MPNPLFLIAGLLGISTVLLNFSLHKIDEGMFVIALYLFVSHFMTSLHTPTGHVAVYYRVSAMLYCCGETLQGTGSVWVEFDLNKYLC